MASKNDAQIEMIKLQQKQVELQMKNSEILKKAVDKGSLILIHAHGDNLQEIEQLAPKLKNKIGTVQVKPFGLVRNFGGFTDGDRCVFLAEHFKASKILLFGFDYGAIVGKFSKVSHEHDYEASEIKQAKLNIARDLIQDLSRRTTIIISNCTRIL